MAQRPEDGTQQSTETYIQQQHQQKAKARQEKREQRAARRRQEVTLMPKLAAVLGFVAGPVGALLGHIWLAWTKDEMLYDDNGTVLTSRRFAWVGVFVGWFMTAVFAVVGISWYSAGEEARAQAELEAQITAEQDQLRGDILTAAPQSPSAGQVDAGFCSVLVEDVYATSPMTFGILNHYGLITDDALAAYDAAASDAVQTPNSATYAEYRTYLAQFDSMDDFAAYGAEAHAEQAQPVAKALDEDILGCVALDDQYLETLLDVQYEAIQR